MSSATLPIVCSPARMQPSIQPDSRNGVFAALRVYAKRQKLSARNSSGFATALAAVAALPSSRSASPPRAAHSTSPSSTSVPSCSLRSSSRSRSPVAPIDAECSTPRRSGQAQRTRLPSDGPDLPSPLKVKRVRFSDQELVGISPTLISALCPPTAATRRALPTDFSTDSLPAVPVCPAHPCIGDGADRPGDVYGLSSSSGMLAEGSGSACSDSASSDDEMEPIAPLAWTADNVWGRHGVSHDAFQHLFDNDFFADKRCCDAGWDIFTMVGSSVPREVYRRWDLSAVAAHISSTVLAANANGGLFHRMMMNQTRLELRERFAANPVDPLLRPPWQRDLSIDESVPSYDDFCRGCIQELINKMVSGAGTSDGKDGA